MRAAALAIVCAAALSGCASWPQQCARRVRSAVAGVGHPASSVETREHAVLLDGRPLVEEVAVSPDSDGWEETAYTASYHSSYEEERTRNDRRALYAWVATGNTTDPMFPALKPALDECLELPPHPRGNRPPAPPRDPLGMMGMYQVHSELVVGKCDSPPIGRPLSGRVLGLRIDGAPRSHRAVYRIDRGIFPTDYLEGNPDDGKLVVTIDTPDPRCPGARLRERWSISRSDEHHLDGVISVVSSAKLDCALRCEADYHFVATRTEEKK